MFEEVTEPDEFDLGYIPKDEIRVVLRADDVAKKAGVSVRTAYGCLHALEAIGVLISGVRIQYGIEYTCGYKNGSSEFIMIERVLHEVKLLSNLERKTKRGRCKDLLNELITMVTLFDKTVSQHSSMETSLAKLQDLIIKHLTDKMPVVAHYQDMFPKFPFLVEKLLKGADLEKINKKLSNLKETKELATKVAVTPSIYYIYTTYLKKISTLYRLIRKESFVINRSEGDLQLFKKHKTVSSENRIAKFREGTLQRPDKKKSLQKIQRLIDAWKRAYRMVYGAYAKKIVWQAKECPQHVWQFFVDFHRYQKEKLKEQKINVDAYEHFGMLLSYFKLTHKNRGPSPNWFASWECVEVMAHIDQVYEFDVWEEKSKNGSEGDQQAYDEFEEWVETSRKVFIKVGSLDPFSIGGTLMKHYHKWCLWKMLWSFLAAQEMYEKSTGLYMHSYDYISALLPRIVRSGWPLYEDMFSERYAVQKACEYCKRNERYEARKGGDSDQKRSTIN